MIVEYQQLDDITNRITYNRILRASYKILRRYVFELNDTVTRENMQRELLIFLKRAKTSAIQNFELSIKKFDPTNPHYIEVDIILYFKNFIHQVHLNVNNVDINV